MNKQTQLLQFYIGALTEQDRLAVERDLLQDPEILLDYLDLKRKIENAAEVPHSPSLALWRRLQSQVPRKRLWYLTAMAGLIAASVLCFYVYNNSSSEIPSFGENRILFDSGSEHSFSSDVM